MKLIRKKFFIGEASLPCFHILYDHRVRVVVSPGFAIMIDIYRDNELQRCLYNDELGKKEFFLEYSDEQVLEFICPRIESFINKYQEESIS
jgi:hypothetical protein